MADGGGSKWKVIESEMDRFEKEISSLARQPHFIPAQLRRPGMPPPPPPMMVRATAPAIISGAPKVYISEPTVSKAASLGGTTQPQSNPPQVPTIRHMIPKQALFTPPPPPPAGPPVATGQLQQHPGIPPQDSTLATGSQISNAAGSSTQMSSSSSTDAPSKPSTSTERHGTEKKKKNKKPKDDGKPKKIVRCAGGQVWEDTSLQDWDPSDFRLFCGDLGNDVTDEVLTRVFGRYPSFQKAKVIRDKRTNKTKGYGFVSFKDPNDFVRAIRELDGRYVGSRPIKLRKSNWKNRNIDQARKRDRERNSLIGIKKPIGKQR